MPHHDKAGQTPPDEPTPGRPLDPDELTQQAITLSKMASHPGFLAILDEISQAPEAEQLETAERLATVENLRSKGVPIPDDFRLTTRFFENPEAATVSSFKIDTATPPGVDDDTVVSGLTVCGSLGLYLCASVGGQALT
ncbi:hypothetical protein ACFWBN_36595 [Streptomyces sp. NPDC059989]|uniref:hypothetical protein n=1 Tax=Streptomyces sp. NPDC059989 TaxID=3347026 RepID=UPI0036B25942